jgi:hypothetical protein
MEGRLLMDSGAESNSGDADIRCRIRIEELLGGISNSAINARDLPAFIGRGALPWKEGGL